MLALVGQIPSFAIDQGHGHLHEIPDQLGLLRHMTKFVARIGTPHEAPGLVDAALHAATTGRPGPVALECPIDTWAVMAEVVFDRHHPIRPAAGGRDTRCGARPSCWARPSAR